MNNSAAKRMAYFGLFIALAFVFSYVEAILPTSIPIPGVKLGLANIVVLTVLYAYGSKEAFIISVVRIILVALTFSNMFTMVYSLAGGLLSWAVMSLFKKIDKFSIIGVSVMGGLSHNMGQLLVAAVLMQTRSLVYYLPILMVGGIVTGIIIGILSRAILKILLKQDN